MPLTGVCTLVLALMTSVMWSLGLFAGVQPSRMLSCGPTVAPFGPQACSGMTPVLVGGLNAPCTAVGVVSVAGSVTSRPPSHVTGPRLASKLQPGGLLAMTGTDV